jgi:hypothetical protein
MLKKLMSGITPIMVIKIIKIFKFVIAESGIKHNKSNQIKFVNFLSIKQRLEKYNANKYVLNSSL